MVVRDASSAGWERSDAGAGQVASVNVVRVSLVVDEIYDAVQAR